MTKTHHKQTMLGFVLDILQNQMCDSSSDLYLPHLIAELKHPQLDPFYSSDSWPLSRLSDTSTGSNQICLQATPDQYYPATGIGAGGPNIVLSAIRIEGLRNVLPEKPVIHNPESDAPQVSVTLDFCTIAHNPDLPTSITFLGNFHMSQNCCIPPRGSNTCSTTSPKYNASGNGTFKITLVPTEDNPIKMTCHSTISVGSGGRFVVTLNQIEVHIPETIMTATIAIQANGKGNRSTYEKLANEALSSASAKQQILASFQQEANTPQIKQELGAMITNKLNGLQLPNQ